MAEHRRIHELEFEMALMGILEDIYELNVRAAGDALDRRRMATALLEFAYFYDDAGTQAQVDVRVQGVPGETFPFKVDLTCPNDVARAAEGCESLAFAVQGFLGDDDVERGWGRREED